MTHQRSARTRRTVSTLCVCVASAAVMLGCRPAPRLVEQFDNGPPGGPEGESEGYRWVGADDRPTEGKCWKTVDPDTLTPQQRARIR